MQTRKRLKQALPLERQRLMQAYRQVVASVREARSVQSILVKERQLRRLMRCMQSIPSAKT